MSHPWQTEAKQQSSNLAWFRIRDILTRTDLIENSICLSIAETIFKIIFQNANFRRLVEY